MDETAQIEFMRSACIGFAEALNAGCGTRLGGKEAYEVLSLVFGELFTPAALHAASPEQARDLAMAVWELLEARASPDVIARALERAAQPQA